PVFAAVFHRTASAAQASAPTRLVGTLSSDPRVDRLPRDLPPRSAGKSSFARSADLLRRPLQLELLSHIGIHHWIGHLHRTPTALAPLLRFLLCLAGTIAAPAGIPL